MQGYKTIKAVAVIALVVSLISIGIYVFKTGKNKRIVSSHSNEYHQVIHHLFDKKIVENQLVENLIKENPPTKASSHDNYLTLQYFKNNEDVDDCCVYYSYYIHIIVRENKLVKAFATEGLFSEIDYVFFNVLNESSEEEYWDSRVRNTLAMANY